MRNFEAGLSILEVSLMLIVTMVMTGALMPAVGYTVRQAKITRATTDETSLGATLMTALGEMGQTRYTFNGSTGVGSIVELLVSDGDTPQECTAAVTGCGFGVTANSWQRPVDNTTGLTDFLERHLVTNNPRGSSANDYPTNGAWRGPYMNAPINPDPWGNRYMVNAASFGGNGNDTDVLSAGPDGSIDTPFVGNPVVAGVDDILVLVEP